jgi:hypothetical protein
VITSDLRLACEVVPKGYGGTSFRGVPECAAQRLFPRGLRRLVLVGAVLEHLATKGKVEKVTISGCRFS